MWTIGLVESRDDGDHPYQQLLTLWIVRAAGWVELDVKWMMDDGDHPSTT